MKQGLFKFIDKNRKRIDKLWNIDMRWTRIFEMIKMKAPVSVKDKDYFFEALNNLNKK